jgi:glycosyltransferase involved in cell wall biosynthesis
MDISFVIPVLEDFPLIVYTVNGIMLDLMDGTIDYEIILIDDGSKTNKTQIDTFGKNYAHLYKNFHYLRNHGQDGWAFITNKGIERAKSDLIIRLDSHVQLCKYFTASVLDIMENNDNISVLHPAIALGGAPTRFGRQYSLITGDGVNLLKHGFWGHWHTVKLSDDLYPIAAGGHGTIAFRKSSIGYYHYAVRKYWGGETYFDIRHWMFDEEVYAAPHIFSIHYPGKRMWAHEKHHEHSVRNRFICAYSLGGIPWLDHVFEYYKFDTKLLKEEVLLQLYSEAISKSSTEVKENMDYCERTLDECFEYWEKNNVYYRPGQVK